MNEIGTLYQNGKQIGGFMDWEIDLRFTCINKPQGRVYSKVLSKATAKKFWILGKPTEDTITANYYSMVRDRLVLINSQIVSVDLSGEINKMINRSLEMTWTT